jgi:hypothetical protein
MENILKEAHEFLKLALNCKGQVKDRKDAERVEYYQELIAELKGY